MNRKPDSVLDVLCVSIVNLNILLSGVDKSVFDQDLTKLTGYDVVVGGDGVNQAVVMTALGLNVGLVGKVGNDNFGRVALEELQRSRVKTSDVWQSDHGKTAVCVVLIDHNGEHVFAAHRGASEEVSPEDFTTVNMKNARVINIGSLYSFPKLHGEALGRIMSQARKMGMITSADCMSDSYQLGSHAMDAVLSQLDYFFPNYDEACYITEKTRPEEIAHELHRRGVRVVVIKMGGKGAYLSDGKRTLQMPAYYVRPVDTTGAGDSYIAGFLYGVLRGYDLESCARLGSAAASVCVGSIGATGHIKNADQLLQFIKERGDYV